MLERRHVVAVARDARGLDDRVAAAQRRERRRRRWPRPLRGPWRRGRRRRGRGRSRCATRRAMAARPSMPRPKTPTRRPARSLKEIACRIEHRRVRGAPGDQELVERPRHRAHREASAARCRWSGAVLARGDRDERRRALVGVAHALEGLRARSTTPQSTSRSRTRCGSPIGSLPEKIASSRARPTNGASTRSVKRHLSHSPHHVVARGRRVLAERAVAAHERVEVLVVARELRARPRARSGRAARSRSSGRPRAARRSRRAAAPRTRATSTTGG